MRIILIDNSSGYVWGDSADLGGRVFSGDDVLRINPAADLRDERDWAMAFAEALDRDIGGESREYERVGRLDGRSGYRAYRADVDGSEAVPVVQDGQDGETIEAIERDCHKICEIASRSAED